MDHFGFSFERIDGDPRPASRAIMSVAAIAGIAEGADATAFPLNEVRFVSTNDSALIGKLGGRADNTLTPALELLAAQLGEFQVAARVLVVRVAKGANIWETIANVAGSAVNKTGVHAFRLAGPRLGVIPRLTIAPGFTSQQKTGVFSVAVTAPGADYVAAPEVTFADPPAGGRKAAGTAVVTAGSVTSITITDPGEGYTETPAVTIAGDGNGAAASATIAPLANPVCMALASVNNILLAHSVVTGPGTTEEAETNWRETLNSFRLIPATPLVSRLQPDGTSENQDMAPLVVGIAIRRDFEKGGLPFHSWANQAALGIEGPSRPIEFSLTDPSTEGQRLLAKNIGVLVRGESGVDDSISDGGFVYLGTDNAGDDELWRFYNVTRGRDYIHLTFMRSLRTYLGKFNLTGHTIQAVINTMSAELDALQADQHILGYKIGFTQDQNTPEDLRKGRFSITFRAEEAPVLRGIAIRSGRYRPAIEAMLENLLEQMDLMAA